MSKTNDTDCLHEISRTGEVRWDGKLHFTIKTDEPITECDKCIHTFVCMKSIHKIVFGKCLDYEERRKTDVWETVEPICRKAVETYGKDAQMDMMIEEMSELTKALLKYRRGREARDIGAMEQAEENILEEIADVYIVLEQMKMIFDKDKEVTGIVAQKLERLEKRIKEQKND